MAATTLPTPRTPFAEWLTAKRQEKGLSVRGLAKEMAQHTARRNCTSFEFAQEVERRRRDLNRYLHNGVYPTQQNLDLISQVLEVPRDEIPADDEDEEAAQPAMLGFALELQRMFDESIERAAEKLLAEKVPA